MPSRPDIDAALKWRQPIVAVSGVAWLNGRRGRAVVLGGSYNAICLHDFCKWLLQVRWSMAASEAITPWLSLLRAGQPEAAQRIWDRYFTRLVRLARKKLGEQRLGIADEEDVAISAFESLCMNARRGHFPQLSDSDGLWRLLVVITARKVLHLVRDEGRRKRAGRQSGGDCDLPASHEDVERLVGNEPTPEFAAELTEQYERLLELLDADQRAIAVAKLEGRTNREIAGRMRRPLRTVERKLQLIRAIWEEGA